MTSKLTLEQALALLSSHPVACAVFSATGQALWIHPGLAKVLHRDESSLQAMTLADLEGQCRSVPGGLVQCAAGIYRLHKTTLSAGGETLPACYLIDASAQSENKVLRERLENEAMIDVDTGLLTYGALIKNLDLLITRSRRYGNPLSALKVQADNGSPDIDPADMLTAVGHLLKDQLRWADLIGRTREDQFIIVMPETTPEAATRICDKLRERLQTLTVPYADGKPCRARAHFGLTAWRKGDDGVMMLDRLQAALREAAGGDPAGVVTR